MTGARRDRLRERLGIAGLPHRSLIIIGAVVVAGWIGVATALTSDMPDWALVALLAAAALVTEWLHVSADDDLPDSAGSQSFSFSSGVHLAAALLLGPFPAAVIAVFGLVVADVVRRAPPARVAFNSSVFALASIAGGLAFLGAGGTTGTVDLPGDLGAAIALWLTYVLVNTLLVSALVSSFTRIPLALLLGRKLRSEFASAAGEAGFGLSLAFFIEANAWGALFLAPLVFGVYQARARLTQLRGETARSLETFANVVDERDPSTHRHSARVASHLRELSEWLDLPASEALALTWAGRLHDLGKISVDSTVLMKAGTLTDEEWETMWRHPRLSAKLLRRFRFAAQSTSAVEYHHERYDGRGYYAVAGDLVPMEAYFIAAADSFDAMVSDRPYRKGMPDEDALAEIERGAGTQFHPLVARAFVAMRRGLDPVAVLSPHERAEILTGFRRERWRVSELPRALRRSQRGAFVVSLAALVAAVASGELILAIAPLFLLAGATAGITIDLVRGRALSRRLARTMSAQGDGRHRLQSVRDVFAVWTHPTWATVVAWDPRSLRATVVTSVGGESEPDIERRIASWLLRDAEDGIDVLWSEEEELSGTWLGLRVPTTSSSEQREAFAIFAFARPPAPWFDRVLHSCVGDVGAHLTTCIHPHSSEVDVERLRVVARSA